MVLDEAYVPFAQDTWMPQLAQFPNLLVLRTLSKLGLAGIRLGYLAGDPAWTAELEKLRPPYNVNVLTRRRRISLLEHLRTCSPHQAADACAPSARALAGRAARPAPASTVFPSAANFVLVRVGGRRAPTRCSTALRQRGI